MLVPTHANRRQHQLAVVSNCQRGANVHRAVCGHHFLRRFGLFAKMNCRLVGVVFQKVWRFLKTEPAQCAARIHVPRTGRVLRPFAEVVRHVLNKRTTDGQSLSRFACRDLSGSSIDFAEPRKGAVTLRREAVSRSRASIRRRRVSDFVNLASRMRLDRSLLGELSYTERLAAPLGDEESRFRTFL